MLSQDHHTDGEDPAHAKRLEENLTRLTEFAHPEPEEAEQTRRNAHVKTRLGRHTSLQNTGEAPSSLAGADVDMRSMSAGSDDDMV